MRKFGLTNLPYTYPDELPPSGLQASMQAFAKKKSHLLFSSSPNIFTAQLSAYSIKWSYRPEPVSIKSEASSCFKFASDQSECQNWIKVTTFWTPR
jgi:hypothetical protein